MVQGRICGHCSRSAGFSPLQVLTTGRVDSSNAA
jgi:hypothetical protein